MNKRILSAALVLAVIGLAGCRNEPGLPPEEFSLYGVRITGVPIGDGPDDVTLLMVYLEDSAPPSRGLAVAGGTLGSYGIPEIRPDGTADTPLYNGTYLLNFLVVESGGPHLPGVPEGFPDAIPVTVGGTRDIVADYTKVADMENGGFFPGNTRVWRNVRFAESVVDGILEIDWYDGLRP